MSTPNLEDLTLEDLACIHESLDVILSVTAGEVHRPYHFNGKSGNALDYCYNWIATRLGEVEKEMERRPVNSYEDAMLLFKARTYCFEGPEEHFREVLRLLKYTQTQTEAA